MNCSYVCGATLAANLYVYSLLPSRAPARSHLKDFATDMLARNIYVVGFSYPVVPNGAARIRVQISASHSQEQVKGRLRSFSSC